MICRSKDEFCQALRGVRGSSCERGLQRRPEGGKKGEKLRRKSPGGSSNA